MLGQNIVDIPADTDLLTDVNRLRGFEPFAFQINLPVRTLGVLGIPVFFSGFHIYFWFLVNTPLYFASYSRVISSLYVLK